jgi:type I restriction enzyme S subunit
MKVKSSVDSSHYPNLPRGWVVARIKDVCQQQETRRPKSDFFRYIDIDSIDNTRHCVTEPKTISTDQAPSRAVKGVCSGDTLFSMVRPYLENIAFIPEELNDCIASTGFYVCRPHKEIVFPHFLFYFLTSSQTISGINAYMRGDNSPSIRKDEMDNFMIPIPPSPEQRRIVAAIETAFEQLDRITAMLA